MSLPEPELTRRKPQSQPGVMMPTHLLATTVPVAISSSGLVTYLQTLFGPLFLGIVGIVTIFFLFTHEIIRFVQFFVLAVAIAVISYRLPMPLSIGQLTIFAAVTAPYVMVLRLIGLPFNHTDLALDPCAGTEGSHELEAHLRHERDFG